MRRSLRPLMEILRWNFMEDPCHPSWQYYNGPLWKILASHSGNITSGFHGKILVSPRGNITLEFYGKILVVPRGNIMLDFHKKILAASHGNMNILDRHGKSFQSLVAILSWTFMEWSLSSLMAIICWTFIVESLFPLKEIHKLWTPTRGLFPPPREIQINII